MVYSWSTNNTKEIKREKDAIADKGYQDSSVAKFVLKYFKPENYKTVLENKNPVFLVMPSTRGDNTIPLGIAELLQKHYSGKIVKGFAGALHETKSANLGAISKLIEPREYEIYEEKCNKTLLEGKNIYIVDDVVTSGTSVDALKKALKEKGIEVNGVLSLGQSDKRLATENDFKRLEKKIAKSVPEDQNLGVNIRMVFGDSLKHKINTIEREITGDQPFKEKNRRIFYEYVKEEAGRFRREIENAPGIQSGERSQTEFFFGSVKGSSPISGMEVREQNDLQWGREVNIEVKDILNRNSSYIKRLSQDDVPEDLKKIMWEYFDKTQDKVTGLQPRWALDEALDDLRTNKVAHSVAAIDFRNLGGLNTEYGHEKTNEVLREVAKEFLQKSVTEWGGEVYRTGGDEFHVIVPSLSQDELSVKMKSLQDKIEKEVVEVRGLTTLPHKSQNGMPTGAGNIDFGCCDSNVLNRSEMLQIADDRLTINKQKHFENVRIREIDNNRLWEYNTKTKKYELSVDLSMEMRNEYGKSSIKNDGPGIGGHYSQGNTGIRNENRGSGPDQGRTRSGRDGRGVPEEKEPVLEEKRDTFEGKSTKDIVSYLIHYAGEKHITVPETTKDRWSTLLESGENPTKIQQFIDKYSINISGPDKEKMGIDI